MMAAQQASCSVLCVDDNPHVAEALQNKFLRGSLCTWLGWLPDANNLVEWVLENKPDIVLLDIDMPGRDPFEALNELTARRPETRTIIFSGHVRRELVDRAIEGGAWGYVSKNEGEDQLMDAIERVLEDEFILSHEVRSIVDA